jgi:16S rRNA (uracil1498-N3)-methyltransferase
VIGPEGGFIHYELEKLVAAGCRPVQIGARILRVETAIPFILGRLGHQVIVDLLRTTDPLTLDA